MPGGNMARAGRHRRNNPMMNAIFHDAQYIAEDLGIGMEEAEKLIKDLRERLERKGCVSIRWKIKISF